MALGVVSGVVAEGVEKVREDGVCGVGVVGPSVPVPLSAVIAVVERPRGRKVRSAGEPEGSMVQAEMGRRERSQGRNEKKGGVSTSVSDGSGQAEEAR